MEEGFSPFLRHAGWLKDNAMKRGNFGKSQGSVLIELALTLPLLLLIVFGIFEFGRAMYIKNTLNSAAREGARRASISPTTPLDIASLENHVRTCIPFDTTGSALVDIKPAVPAHGIDTITVTVTLPFHTAVPLLLTQLKEFDLKGEASMLYE
jgi:hypothetical protein